MGDINKEFVLIENFIQYLMLKTLLSFYCTEVAPSAVRVSYIKALYLIKNQ